MEIVESIVSFATSQIPGFVAGLTASIGILLNGYIKIHLNEVARKKKEKRLLGTQVLQLVTPLNIEDTDKTAVHTAFQVISEKVKGYDYKLGEKIYRLFSTAVEAKTHIRSPIEKLNTQKDIQDNYDLFANAMVRVIALREEVSLGAHQLRGTKGKFAIVYHTNKERLLRFIRSQKHKRATLALAKKTTS